MGAVQPAGPGSTAATQLPPDLNEPLNPSKPRLLSRLMGSWPPPQLEDTVLRARGSTQHRTAAGPGLGVLLTVITNEKPLGSPEQDSGGCCEWFPRLSVALGSFLAAFPTPPPSTAPVPLGARV